MIIRPVPLDMITPNPWQPRQGTDQSGIEELALSIARDGLLQIPVGRYNPDPIYSKQVQLAIGHRRLEAYRLLEKIQAGILDGIEDKERPALVDAVRPVVAAGKDFHEMPLDTQDLTDQQMFEMGISENLQRKDLNPVEQAAAMKRYMDEFHVTSEDAGTFFGVSGSTVRGTVRMLDLPEAVKDKVAAGEVTVRAARRILSIQAAVPAAIVAQVAEDLADPDRDPDDVIEAAMSRNQATVMWQSWRDQKTPLGGDSLWPLPHKFSDSEMPELKAVDAAKALEIEFTAESRAKLNKWIFELYYVNERPERAQKLIAGGAPENDINRLAQLIYPLPCPDCTFYVRANNVHYCLSEACHVRKAAAWAAREAERLSKKLKIAVYDPGQDGKEMLKIIDSNWSDDGKRGKKLFADRDPDLRLVPTKPATQAHDFTESSVIKVVVVGEAVKKIKAAKAKEKTNSLKQGRDQARQYKVQRACQQASEQFIQTIAGPAFAPAFEGLTNIPAAKMVLGRSLDWGKEKLSKPRQLERVRIAFALKGVENIMDWNDKSRGPVVIARKLQGAATTCGIKLSETWMASAKELAATLEEYEDENGKRVKQVVAAETEES